MSYTPEEEQIDEPIDQLIEAMDRLRSVCTARIRSERWMDDHMDRLNEVIKDTYDLEVKLLRLK